MSAAAGSVFPAAARMGAAGGAASSEHEGPFSRQIGDSREILTRRLAWPEKMGKD
jgi:hypothetical protein